MAAWVWFKIQTPRISSLLEQTYSFILPFLKWQLLAQVYGFSYAIKRVPGLNVKVQNE